MHANHHLHFRSCLHLCDYSFTWTAVIINLTKDWKISNTFSSTEQKTRSKIDCLEWNKMNVIANLSRLGKKSDKMRWLTKKTPINISQSHAHPTQPPRGGIEMCRGFESPLAVGWIDRRWTRLGSDAGRTCHRNEWWWLSEIPAVEVYLLLWWTEGDLVVSPWHMTLQQTSAQTLINRTRLISLAMS